MDPIRLDRTDLALLAELQRDGRISNADLAERVKLSPSACLRRVQRLEQAGVLAGYAAVLDPAKVGLGLQAFVRVQLARHDAEAIGAFTRRIQGWDEVVACHALTGDSHVAGEAGPGHLTSGWWDGLVGPGAPVDTDEWFVVCANVLGGCYGSSGPNQMNPATGRLWGADFPFVTVEDWVESQARLADQLGIRRFAAVVGGRRSAMDATTMPPSSVSAPVPPDRLSKPAPPARTSLPASPRTVSLPPSPSR